jgi:hypothetical protein
MVGSVLYFLNEILGCTPLYSRILHSTRSSRVFLIMLFSWGTTFHSVSLLSRHSTKFLISPELLYLEQMLNLNPLLHFSQKLLISSYYIHFLEVSINVLEVKLISSIENSDYRPRFNIPWLIVDGVSYNVVKSFYINVTLRLPQQRWVLLKQLLVVFKSFQDLVYYFLAFFNTITLIALSLRPCQWI